MKLFAVLAVLILVGCATKQERLTVMLDGKRETVVVDGFTFIGIPKVWSEAGVIVAVEKVTKGSCRERQLAFRIDPNQRTPPPLKIGVRYSITCAYGVHSDHQGGYKIQSYHEVE